MKRYFITGTDTDCGKTYVLCQLLADFQKKNKTAIGLKPVASGCSFKNASLCSDDAEKIQKANPDLSTAICQWKFLPPIAPHIAAELADQRLSAEEVTQFCVKPAFNTFDSVLIEGAGGLMAPLNESETWIDFIQLAKLEVILVVGMRLGCINHALLTETVLKQYKIPCFGWIANCLDPNMLVLEENIATLQKRMTIPLIGKVPYQGSLIMGG